MSIKSLFTPVPIFNKPKILVFFISFKCNLRCAMCFGWVKQKQIIEPALDKVTAVVNDPVLKNNLEVINITGGEPTLRDDLTGIIKIIIRNCARLKQIDLSTNGVNTERVADQVERILALLLPVSVRLTVTISLDGVGDTHERVRGTDGIFKHVDRTIDALRELMTLYPFFDLGLNMTVSRLNCGAMETVKAYALSKGLWVNFTLSAISDIGVESIKMKEGFELGEINKREVIRFLTDAAPSDKSTQNYYRFLITWLKTGKRTGGCAFRDGRALLLEPNGEIYLCGNFREFRLGNIFSESYAKLVKKAAGFSQYYPAKCVNCVSNCYV